MSGHGHSYSRLQSHGLEPPPAVEARFFYTSPFPIDDPLSPLPPPTNVSAPVRHAPRPFTEYDHAALEEAWQALRGKLSQFRAEQQREKAPQQWRKSATSQSRLTSAQEGNDAQKRSAVGKQQHRSADQTSDQELGDVKHSPGPELPHSAIEVGSQPDTTGTPFIRAPSRKKMRVEADAAPTRPKILSRDTYEWDDDSHLVEHSPARPSTSSTINEPSMKVAVGVSRLHQVEMPALEMIPIYWEPVHDEAPVMRATWFYQETMLPVEPGIANLLEVGYLDLRVWTDTWKDELRSAVAVGSLGEEKIVHKLWPDKPYTPSSGSRTSSPAGFVNTEPRDNLRRTAVSNITDDVPETPERVREHILNSAAEMIDASNTNTRHDNKASGRLDFDHSGPTRAYGSYGVIYANDREATLLKPSLLPSNYYGRRPFAHYIARGRRIGIPLVRGFDQAAWNRLHPARTDSKATKAESGIATAEAGVSPEVRRKSDPGLARAERPRVTDLVLVVHGIGQKLSRRMESWHFTHAMNAFRREVQVEIGSREVSKSFRDDMGGIMVLPVNWRQALSLEDGGYGDEAHDANSQGFTLEDITPDTLPSVRNIVSDVMLDIPYYMSHHQPKMIAAVIGEANRVYKLWCRNNPSFAQYGRVHIIAHSLGSVMAIDILSRQPTEVPRYIGDGVTETSPATEPDHFLFNTSNLFLAGSPAGFFLLLRKAQLMPRIDQTSAAADFDPTANTLDICSERGQYGCIAVENVYNIINGYDPVAYRMNAAVDSVYADSLKKAYIPSAVTGWFRRRDSTSWFSGGGGGGATVGMPTLPRLPSNVELETHNFTREEIAEKRMYLLNDNGQIDYHVRYGGGPLEIQYLTMLSAHSSYWLLKDFTRMIVLEIGRPRGREGAMVNMRAVKKKVHLSA